MTFLLTNTEEEMKEEGPNEVQMQKPAVRITCMMLVSAWRQVKFELKT